MAAAKYTVFKSPEEQSRSTDDQTPLEGVEIQSNDSDSLSNTSESDIFHAVASRNIKRCQKLVSHKNVNKKNENGQTLLHFLARDYSKRINGSDEIFRLLLDRGAKLNVRDKERNTPLHIAAKEGNEELCKQLIDAQRNIDSSSIVDSLNSKNRTPLHLAARQGQATVISLLLKENANPNLTDSMMYLPLHYAAELGYSQCCELLNDFYPKCISSNCIQESPLMLAAKGGHEWCCIAMNNLTKDDLDYQDKDGNTALHKACRKGFDKFVHQLLKKGASLDIQNSNGNSPIMDAILKNAISCVDHLINYGANLNLTNNQNKGVLHLAADGKTDECMNFLLNNDNVKQHIDNKDVTGSTALHISIKKDCDKCSLMLLGAGASPSEACNNKLTPLHLATRNSKMNVLLELLKFKDLDISPCDRIDEKTPLHLAAERGSREMCLKLLKRGARISAIDKYSRTVLHTSAYHGHHDIVKLFLKRGAKTRALDVKHSTALHAAAAKGHLETFKVLFDADKHLCTLKDKKGRLSMDIAFNKGQQEVFEFLLQNLPFKDNKKLPSNIAQNLHSYSHKALKTGNRSELETILKSRYWEAGFLTRHENQTCDNFRQLIRQYPDLAKVVMDKCVTDVSSVHPSKTYNFRILEDNYHTGEKNVSSPTVNIMNNNTQQENEMEGDPFLPESGILKPEAKEYISNAVKWKKSHPVHIMVKFKRLNLLQHPLIDSWMTYKWKAYIRKIYYRLLFSQIFFMISLGGFLSNIPNWKWISMNTTILENKSCEEILKIPDGQLKFEYPHIFSWVFHVALTILTLLMAGIEGCNIKQMRKHYFEWTNIFRLGAITSAIILLIPLPPCVFLIKQTWAWELGVVGFLLSCMCLISTINKMPSCSIFANLSHRFLKSYLKGLAFISIIIVTFAYIFHLLLFQDQSFKNFPLVIAKTVVWVMGDLGYDDTFGSKNLRYPILTHFVFFFFICMVGAFIVSLVKAPPSDPHELSFNRDSLYAEFVLTIDVCYPNTRRKHVIGTYKEKNDKSWIFKLSEKLSRSSTKDSLINRSIQAATNNAAMIEIPAPKKPWIVDSIERLSKRFELNTDDDEFPITDDANDKLDVQNKKLDQLLTICKQLVHSNHCQNEQIQELKQNYQMQNELISELRKQLGMPTEDSRGSPWRCS